jgi:hypothetical protein
VGGAEKGSEHLNLVSYFPKRVAADDVIRLQ